MAALSDMTTEYLTLALITNPSAKNGAPNIQNSSFPWTLVVNGQLTTPITRAQILTELNNRVAADNLNGTSTAYMGDVVSGQVSINSNGTLSNLSVLAPAANLIGPTAAANQAAINNGGSDPEPVFYVGNIY
jgi:hypothetical protein